MDTIFINSENSQTSDHHRLLHKLSDKMNLKRSDTYVALSKFSICYTWKRHTKITILKHQLRHISNFTK